MTEQITIGYLSWKRCEILNQTLKSHKNNGLFDLIPSKNRLIFFQEICEMDIKIATEFDCNYIGNKKNIGISNDFIELVKNCKTEYFIFCENDWNLIENKKTTELILIDCLNILNNNISDIIKLRHRINHGLPLYSKPKDVETWLKCNVSKFPYKLESLCWLPFPNKIYNNILEEYDGNYKWYTTGLNHQLWSNNIFIGKTAYLKNNILPLLNNFTLDNNNYSGLEDILINYNNHLGKNNDLDTNIFNYKKIRITSGEGLFTHNDKI